MAEHTEHDVLRLLQRRFAIICRHARADTQIHIEIERERRLVIGKAYAAYHAHRRNDVFAGPGRMTGQDALLRIGL